MDKEEFLKEIMSENHSSYYASKDLDSQKAHFLSEVKSEMEKMSSSSESAGTASGEPSARESPVPEIKKIEKLEKTPRRTMEEGSEKMKNESPVEASEKTLPTSQEKKRLKTEPSENESETKLDTKQQKEFAKEKKHAIRKNFRREIEGWYVGLGATSSITNARAINQNVDFSGDSQSYSILDISNSLGAASGISNCDIQRDVNELPYSHHFKASGNVTSDFVKGRSSKIGFSVAGGFGKFVHGDVYAGADVCLDFVKRQTDVSEAFTTRVAYTSQVKQGGITPTVAARIGVYSDTLDSMIYGRLGCSIIKSDTEINGLGKIKMASLTPVVGAGLQKKFDHFSVRVEGDYRFLTHKNASLSRGTIEADRFDDNVKNVTVTNGVSLKSHGYAMRIMSMLHI
jgi:hypothetical protein